jgi:hypothetical protein
MVVGVSKKALEQAWVEYQRADNGPGVHVGTMEAMQLLREAASGTPEARSRVPLSPEQEEQARFFDWLLHIKRDKALAYELLQRLGTLTVGPRQYWISDQGGRRAIAWESRFEYPGTDSEIWDLIFVD